VSEWASECMRFC